jgi:hypothetical protein
MSLTFMSLFLTFSIFHYIKVLNPFTSGSDFLEALHAIALIVPAPTEVASWMHSASSSSVIPIFLAPARLLAAQGSQRIAKTSAR